MTAGAITAFLSSHQARTDDRARISGKRAPRFLAESPAGRPAD
jgi:hypothetical protein